MKYKIYTRAMLGANLFTAFLSLFAIIILYYALTFGVGSYEEYMYGLWTADDDFCDDAGIASMMIFIGPSTRSWTWTGPKLARAGYILIADDISNQPLTMTYKSGWPPYGGKYTVNAQFEFESEDIFETDGKNLRVELDMQLGCMKIYDSERIYGKLYKQHSVSNTLAIDSD